jgi:RNA polymerase sigma factor (sigma-70 family)
MEKDLNAATFNSRAYLAAMIRNAAKDALKTMRPRFLTEPMEGIDVVSRDPTDRIVEALTIKDELAEVLADQEILNLKLHLWKGYTFKEIGALLEKKENTVKQQYHRAIKKLQKHLTCFHPELCREWKLKR